MTQARNGSSGKAKAIAFAIALALGVTLHGEYIGWEVEIVPAARLIANLESLSKTRPTDMRVRLNLARAHAMAYAQKTERLQIKKSDPDAGVDFGIEPKLVPFVVSPSNNPAQERAARAHLTQAIAVYEEVVTRSPGDLVARLGYGWCLEQSGNKDKAIGIFREVIEKAWMLERDVTRADLGWRAISSEGAQYLIPLLDADKDRDEISMLRDRIRQMGNVVRPITPIVVALSDAAALPEIVDLSATVSFDADGNGATKKWTWITPKAGWLIYDPKRSGKISSALQLFGSVTFWLFWENGYEALGSLDDDHDGKLVGPELAGLGIWQDVNVNGISEQGEVAPLSAWGITEVSTRYEDDESDLAVAFSRQGVTFASGATAATYDVLLHRR